MKKAVLFFIPVIFLFNTCALEIANVIGPGGGWVFYDKGNYDGGWRYIECSSADFGEIKDSNEDSIMQAMKSCEDHSGGWYNFGWELPNEAQLKKMLECFSYGLTKFSPDFYYISLNTQNGYEAIDPKEPESWEVVILHKNFDKELNGKVEKVDFPDVVKIRPIRKF